MPWHTIDSNTPPKGFPEHQEAYVPPGPLERLVLMIQQFFPQELTAHELTITIMLLGTLFRVLLPLSAEGKQCLEQITGGILMPTYPN